MTEPPEFAPLRTDPPPSLGSTLWTRSVLALTIVATAVATIVVDRLAVAAGTLVIALFHVAVAGLLVVWTVVAMDNVDALMPATRYTASARGPLGGALWVGAFLAPVGVVAAVGRVGSSFADDDALASTMWAIVAVLVALLVAWSPFRFVARQAGRIGVPQVAMTAWFWAPLGTFVGGLQLLALLYREGLDGGSSGRPPGVLTIYALSVAVFGWSTWRAVRVFDEVIDLRWQRWRIEWEQTLADLAAQPLPGPERRAP